VDLYVCKLIYISKGMWCQKWGKMIHKEKNDMFSEQHKR
jgi:hypothetical protein